jgi:triacylglycerol lipase
MQGLLSFIPIRDRLFDTDNTMMKRRFQNFANILLVLALLNVSPAVVAVEPGTVNFTEIRQQAEFANAAYRIDDKIRDLVESRNFALTLYHTIPDTQITFFLATSEQTKTQIISVRGTSNIENAMVDISLKLTIDQNTGIRLHQGFAYAAKQVYTKLKPLIKAGYKIQVTGHSLGGAVALILAIYLDADQIDIEQVVTFGQPKVTNISGAKKIRHINIIRIVTAVDLVPLVPLFDPLDIRNLDVYWHAGMELILLDDNQYAILQGLDSMLRATKFTQTPLTEDNLKHHHMSLYLEMIETRTESSELVPYKTDLNLFNLFGSG